MAFGRSLLPRHTAKVTASPFLKCRRCESCRKTPSCPGNFKRTCPNQPTNGQQPLLHAKSMVKTYSLYVDISTFKTKQAPSRAHSMCLFAFNEAVPLGFPPDFDFAFKALVGDAGNPWSRRTEQSGGSGSAPRRAAVRTPGGDSWGVQRLKRLLRSIRYAKITACESDKASMRRFHTFS